MSDRAGKNSEAWDALFEKYDIPGHIRERGSFLISADQIREFREPRLMAKFDHRINLPPIFARNGLAILPVSRGDYLIARMDAYHTFEDSDGPARRFSLPPQLQSLSAETISSETIAIHCAMAAGIFEDFLEDSPLIPTVSGRMGSESFRFRIEAGTGIEPIPVDVSRSQIEIDAALEGQSCLALIEAKLDLAEDFLIRQLYYPFRVWAARIPKRVRPVFLVYSNGVFRLFEYEFSDPSLYNSLRLVRQRNYTLETLRITREDLISLAEQTSPVEEPPIAFPQADRLDRVINLCELLADHPLTRGEITEQYAFDVRQANYYADAGRYLGLIRRSREDGGPVYSLTEEAVRILRLPYRPRQLEICRRIFRHRAFRETFLAWAASGNLPDRREIVEIMRDSHLYHVDSGSTYSRRASTVSGWIGWILRLIQEDSQQSLFHTLS